MKACVWLGPREMAMQELPVPHPRAGEVLLRVRAAGICGSDLSGYLGQNSLRVPPLIMGHEFAGQVAAVGEGVAGWRAGDAAVVNPLITCGECAACRKGLDNLCAHRPGAFAEYVAVPAANCLPLPAGLDWVAGALTEPLACGVRAARLGPGTRAMLLGAGTIGLMCIRAIRKAGGEVCLAADVNPARLEMASVWGAQAVCDARAQDPAGLVRELTAGTGVDVAIDAAGTTATRRAAVQAVRPGGTVVLLGLHEAESPIQANHIVRSEIQVIGSFAYTRADFEYALVMLAEGDVQPSGGWLDQRGLAACAGAFAELVDGSPAVAKIVLRP